MRTERRVGIFFGRLVTDMILYMIAYLDPVLLECKVKSLVSRV